jgi:hypothetical protein
MKDSLLREAMVSILRIRNKKAIAAKLEAVAYSQMRVW